MIEVQTVSKRFGHITAVDDLSFSVGRGEVLGLLGPNGAGKSTTMKMITGFIPPTSGGIIINNLDLSKNKIQSQSRMGYVPENAPLYEDLLVGEFLRFICEIRGIPREQVNKCIEDSVEICSLQEVRGQKIETLSKGYKRRVCLAQALIHDPDILILDEPTDGLDPNQKFEMRKLIKKLAAKKSIIISTHALEEVEAVCSRCIIISQGKKLFDGSAEELKAKSSQGKIEDVFRVMTTGAKVEGVTWQ